MAYPFSYFLKIAPISIILKKKNATFVPVSLDKNLYGGILFFMLFGQEDYMSATL